MRLAVGADFPGWAISSARLWRPCCGFLPPSSLLLPQYRPVDQDPKPSDLGLIARG